MRKWVRLPAPGLRWYTAAVEWPASWERLGPWLWQRRLELLLVALCTAVAAFLRVYRLAELPPGLHGDEALTGLDALRIIDEGWIGPYVGSGLGQPTGPLYFTALVFKLSHVSLFTLRLSMSLLAVATVPAAYILFRLGFGRWVALFAALALTFSFWHLHYSRMAFMVVSMPLITTLVAIAILLALRSDRRWPWLVGGLLLGVGVYSYNGYVAFLTVIAAFLAVVLLLSRFQWRRYLKRFVFLAGAAVLIAIPMIDLVLTQPGFYFQHHRLISVVQDPGFRDAETIVEKVGFLAGRAWDGATLFYSHPSVDFSDAMGGRGVLNVPMALLAYAGLVIALARWRSPPHLLLALMVLAGLGVTLLVGENWGELRQSLLTVPFVYGLAGIAAVEVVRAGRRAFGLTGLRVAAAGMAVLLVGGILWNTWYYFGFQVRQEYTEWVFANDLVDGLRVAHSFDTPGRIYFYAPRWGYDYETRRFLYPASSGIDRSREFGEFSLERLDAGPVTYLLLPPYTNEVARLKELYPGGVAIEQLNDRGAKVFSVYHLP
jgi:4-amino-4-deoxy-L-arabinose transferase-like glycosyltransferase